MTAILQSGATLGRYRLMQRIGVGGMAEVFLGVQAGAAGFQREVAIKVLRPGEDDEQLIESLAVEAQLAAQLGHPNIVQVIDFGVHGEGFYLVMEYLNGWPLENVMRTARKAGVSMPLDVVVDIGLQALDALGFAHEAVDGEGNPLEVIHRDVKPANMMVLPMGLVKVVDFGIAKAATVESRTMTGMAKGTPSYMAPEQLRGHEVGPSADIYALAVSLFEMAVAKPLFTGESFMDLLARRLRPVGPEDLELLEAAQPLLTPIVARGLVADPNERWPDAASMAEALRGIAPVTTRQPLRGWLKELNMEGCRPLTQSGIRVGIDTGGETVPRAGAPVAGTESIEGWKAQEATAEAGPADLHQDSLTEDLIAQPDEITGSEAEPEVPPTRAQFFEPSAAPIEPEVPPTRAQFIEPEVPPTRAQFIEPEVPPTRAQMVAPAPGVDDDGASKGTVFQTRVPTSPELSSPVLAAGSGSDTGSGDSSSSTTLFVVLALLGVGTVLGFAAWGVWLWGLGESDEPGAEDEAASVVDSERPDSVSPDKGSAGESAGKDSENVAALKASTPTPSRRTRPRKSSPSSQSKPKKGLKARPVKTQSPPKEPTKKTQSPPDEATKPAVEPEGEGPEATRSLTRRAIKTPVAPKVEPRTHSGMPDLNSLGVPTGELLRGTTGGLKVDIVGGSGWTYQIGGGGSSKVGRTRSNLAAGPVDVAIFDSNGRRRGSATVVILPGNTSRCSWRVDGEALRPIKDGSCTQF